MKVLLISGTGWVGSHIASECVKAGHDLTVLSRGLSRRTGMPENVKHVCVDRADVKAFHGVLETLEAEIVIDVIPGYFGTENTRLIVDTFRGKVRRYLHCGSTGVYTPLQYVPGDEEHPCVPLPALGDAFIRKLEADRVILDAAREGFPATVLRPTCILGAGELPLDNFGGRSARFLRDILEGKTIEVPGDGEMLLQPVHVRDLAKAFICCIGKADCAGPLYNISGRKAVTFNRYLAVIRAILGKKGREEYAAAEELLGRHADDRDMSIPDFRFFCRHMCFSIEKARAELGYEPSFSLEDSLRDTLAWALDAIGAGEKL